jgi:hypothetical protein
LIVFKSFENVVALFVGYGYHRSASLSQSDLTVVETLSAVVHCFVSAFLQQLLHV